MFNILTGLTYFMFTVLFKVVKYVFQKSVIKNAKMTKSSSKPLLLSSTIQSVSHEKLNSTTDDESPSSTSSHANSHVTSSSYFSQTELSNSNEESILAEHNTNTVDSNSSSVSNATSNDISDHVFETSTDHELKAKKDLSLHIEDLYDRLQVVNTDLSNHYIQNIIKTSLIKYSIKKSINTINFKYYNDDEVILNFFCFQYNL